MKVLSLQNVSSADAVGLSTAHNLLSAHVFPETVQVDLSNRREEQRLRHLWVGPSKDQGSVRASLRSKFGKNGLPGFSLMHRSSIAFLL